MRLEQPLYLPDYLKALVMQRRGCNFHHVDKWQRRGVNCAGAFPALLRQVPRHDQRHQRRGDQGNDKARPRWRSLSPLPTIQGVKWWRLARGFWNILGSVLASSLPVGLCTDGVTSCSPVSSSEHAGDARSARRSLWWGSNQPIHVHRLKQCLTRGVSCSFLVLLTPL